MAKVRKNKTKGISLDDLTKFDTMLPNYSLLSILFRVIISFLVAVVIIQLVSNSIEDDAPLKQLTVFTYIRTTIIFLLLGEVLIILDSILEYFLPFPNRIRQRILLQLLLSVLIIIVYFYFSVLTTEAGKSIPEYITYFSLGIGFTFVIFYSNGLLVTRMTQRWVLSQKQIEKMKQEKIKMDYNALQEQLNPNFLFNNLSVLKSLIMFDKEAATKFTDNFTDVYRYALQSKKENLIAFSKEIEFIESYIALHKERLGESFQISFELNANEVVKKIVPLTLQLLIENALRHNVIDKNSPLHIEITAKNSELIVENKINLKSTSYSSRQGLAKLQNRYKFLTDRNITINKKNGKFIVTVPLL